jgi:rhodanese-related sulfurtransferase
MIMKTMKRVLILNVYSQLSAHTEPGKHMNGLRWLFAGLTLTWLLAPHLTLAQDFRFVVPEELLRQIEARAEIILLDAQPAKKYAEAHIKGAVNVSGPAQIEDLDLPHSRPLIIYCDCEGEEASKFLAKRLVKNGYKQENILILKGGWYRWLELGYPVEKGNQPQL